MHAFLEFHIMQKELGPYYSGFHEGKLKIWKLATMNMVEIGFSTEKIATILGCSLETIQVIKGELEVCKLAAEELLEEKIPMDKIAKLLDCSIGTILTIEKKWTAAKPIENSFAGNR